MVSSFRRTQFLAISLVVLFVSAPVAEASMSIVNNPIVKLLQSLTAKKKSRGKQKKAPTKTLTKTKFVKRTPRNTKSGLKKSKGRRSSASGIIGRPAGIGRSR